MNLTWAIALGVSAAAWLTARRQMQGYWVDRWFRPDPVPDLRGRTVLVTGGNSGVGLAAAIGFARFGADVVIACRSASRADAAVAEIVRRSGAPPGRVRAVGLDLADLASVRACAAAWLATDVPLHILVDNAGIAPPPTRTLTDDGHEVAFQVNYLGHFLLTQLLLPRLEQTAAGEAPGTVRIVSVSSGAHTRADLHFDDPTLGADYTRGEAYGQSKLAQILHARELQRRVGDAVKVLVCTPGFCRTGIFGASPLAAVVIALGWVIGRSAATGAGVVLFCALSDEVTGGRYYSNLLEKPAQGKDGIANDPEAAARLWTLSERLVDPG